MKAILRRTRISPKKANLVAGMVRGMNAKKALDVLRFTPKKGADILYKVVNSAAYNAKNNFKQPLDELIITKILVTKGPTYKRSLPISRGRVHPVRKRTSHITVEVGIPEGVIKKASSSAKASVPAKAPMDKPIGKPIGKPTDKKEKATVKKVKKVKTDEK